MLSICSSSSSSLRFLHRNPNFWLFLHSQFKTNTFISCINSCSKDDSASLPKQIKVRYDLSEDFFGLEVDMQPRNANSRTPKQKSWFGPNGQYIKELPCPSCRGRGYTPCTKCDIERSRIDCSECNGKGMKTCQQCSGECVIWEETIDERPWERARSISPVKVKEDDYVDNLDIKLDTRKKSKRVYHSPTSEVGLKISQSLKSLNARTGLFSKHMRILHQDPKLHAQRVAAIKKAKGTDAARKRASEASKAFFSDPENRRKRSLSMKGVKFFCSNCGREGHRRNYCPEIVNNSLIDRRFRCRLCGQKGHNQRTCERIKVTKPPRVVIRHHRCRVCGGSGHNRRTCSQIALESPSNKRDSVSVVSKDRRRHLCRLCHEEGHNIRTCPARDFKENTS